MTKKIDRVETSLKESTRDLSLFKFKFGGVVALVLFVVFGLLIHDAMQIREACKQQWSTTRSMELAHLRSWDGGWQRSTHGRGLKAMVVGGDDAIDKG